MGAYFNFRAAKIHYRLIGKGKTMVFLHGFLGSMDLWKDQVADLKSRYQLLLIDLPAHGRSESLGYVHSMELIADLVNSLLRHLKKRRVILVGHSMGGYAALAFAEKHTDYLSALILVNTTAAADTNARVNSRKQLIEILPKKRGSVTQQLVNSFFLIPSFKRRYIVKKYQRWALQAELKGVVASVRGMMERKEREIILKFAPYPYLIIAGSEDPIISLNQNTTEAKLNPKGSLVVIDNSSHITPMEQPWRLNTEMQKFLREI